MSPHTLLLFHLNQEFCMIFHVFTSQKVTYKAPLARALQLKIHENVPNVVVTLELFNFTFP